MYMIVVFISLVSFNSNAALRCDNKNCDVRWDLNDLHLIKFSTVCYNYKGKSEYKECRRLAIQAFKLRCDSALKNYDKDLKKRFCDDALKNYVP